MERSLDEVWFLEGNTSMFFDKDASPISPQRFAALHSDLSYRIIARDTKAGFSIITAWLGSDQGDSWLDNSPPLIFGTILKTPTGYDTASELLAATEEQARENHQSLLAALPSPISPDQP